MAKAYYINGFLVSNARKVCSFYFGDFVKEVELNQQNRTFDISLHKELNVEGKVLKLEETINVDYFKEFWGPQWRLMDSDKQVIQTLI